MRILHVIPSAESRGGPIFASDLIAALGENGLQHRVALLRDSERLAVGFDAPSDVLGGNRFQLPGVRISTRAVLGLRKLADAWKPDIIQSHGGEPLKYVVAARLHRRSRIVLRSVGLVPDWIRHGPRKTAWAYLIRKSTRVVAVAEIIREETIRVFGVSPSRVLTIPNAVDSRRLRPQRSAQETRRLLGIPEDHRVLLSLGALTWEKEPLTHVEVTARIAQRGRLVTHLIAGDGPMRRQVVDAVREAGLNDQVQVLGARRDIGDLLSAADIVLFASRTDGMEGMPATIIEAGMMERPVVAYAVAGVADVIESGFTGLLVTPGDLDGLVDRAIELLDSDDLRREMGAAARGRCVSRFDIQSVAAQYKQLYESLA
jgi:glycosyltransferase involved in cell wall biosynthesis